MLVCLSAPKGYAVVIEEDEGAQKLRNLLCDLKVRIWQLRGV